MPITKITKEQAAQELARGAVLVLGPGGSTYRTSVQDYLRPLHERLPFDSSRVSVHDITN